MMKMKWINLPTWALIIVTLFSFTGCDLLGIDPKCNSVKDDYKSKYGVPEKVYKYDSDGYHSEDWWYYSQGFSVDFTWGSDVGGCKVSTFEFDPI